MDDPSAKPEGWAGPSRGGPPLSAPIRVPEVQGERVLRRSVGCFLRRNADLWVALGLVALLTIYYLRQPFPIDIEALDDYDVSMFADLVFKAQHGIWLGKQVLFTSGPLFQWMLAHVAMLRGNSLGSLYLALLLLQFWISIAALYGTGRLLLAHQPAWRRSFCLLLLVVFWMPVFLIVTQSKFIVPPFWLAVFACLSRDLKFSWRGALVRGVLFAGAIASSCLFSCDVGFYTTAEFVLMLGLRALAPGINRAELKALGKMVVSSLGALAISVLAINQAFGAALDFHFWRGIAAIISAYRWSEALAMPPDARTRFFVVLGTCAAIFAVFIIRQQRNPRTGPWQQVRIWQMLIGALIFAQAGLVVSEIFHIALSVFPLIMMSCYLLFGAAEEEKAARSATLPVLLALGVSAILSGPNHVFIPRNLAAGARPSASSCAPGMKEVQDVCLNPLQAQQLESVSARLAALSRPTDTVAIFPYQNIYGPLSGRQLSGDVLQNYLVAGDYLNAKQLGSWQREQPQFAIYSPDGVSSTPLGGIPNFTRTPEEWLYLQQHYFLEEQPIPGVMLLQRDDERARRWQMQTQKLPLNAKKFVIAGPSRTQLTGAMQDAGADFYRLRVRLEYSVMWKLLKPAFILFYMDFADGSEKVIPAMVEPNHGYDVWLYPARESLLANYFWADAAGWRSNTPAVTHIDIGIVNMDWVSVVPYRLELQKIDSVRLFLAPARRN